MRATAFSASGSTTKPAASHASICTQPKIFAGTKVTVVVLVPVSVVELESVVLVMVKVDTSDVEVTVC